MPDAEARIRALPIWQGAIACQPLKGGLSNESFTVTDSSGKYKFVPGAVPGDYRVLMSRFVLSDGSTVSITEETSPEDAALGEESMPTKYSDPGESELKATVGPKGGIIDFDDLTSE